MNASGRDDTSLANALLNGCVYALSLIAAIKRKPVMDLTRRDIDEVFPLLHLAIMGDDSLALLPAHLYYEGLEGCLEENIRQFGFKLTMARPSTDPFSFVFLGMRPYPSNGRWWFARTVGRALFKWGWRLDMKSKDGPAFMTGDAIATAKVDRVVPILYDLAEAYCSTRQGCKAVHQVCLDKPWRAGDPGVPRYTDHTLQYVAAGYDVTYRELCDCVAFVAGLKSFPCVIDHPVLI
jgi:hypothetical protein